MDDYVKTFGKYSEDLILECDAYSQKLAAKKAAAQRRRQVRNLQLRIAASATMVLVVVGVLIGGLVLRENASIDIKPTYTRYESFQAASEAIGVDTLLSYLPKAEIEKVDIYDPLSNTESWIDIFCNGVNKEYEVVINIALSQNKFPEQDDALYLNLYDDVKVQTTVIDSTSVRYVFFEKSVFAQDGCVVIATFVYKDIFYQFQYIMSSDLDTTVSEALSYIETLLISADA